MRRLCNVQERFGVAAHRQYASGPSDLEQGSTISAIEQNHSMPQPATIEKLAAAFDISSDELPGPRFV